MTTRLMLLRHADALPPQKNQKDFERILSPFGRQQIHTLEEKLKTKQYTPQLILCSPATRTRQTLELLNLHSSIKIIYDMGLYEGDHNFYQSLFQQHECSNLLMIGHNPSIGNLFRHFVKDNSSAHNYPTAGMAVLDIVNNNFEQNSPVLLYDFF